MRFTKPYWEGIADGSVTVAFRRWRSPTVVAGRPYRTGGGRIEVLSVDVVDPAAITAADAVRAGHASPDEVRASLEAMAGRPSRPRSDAGRPTRPRSDAGRPSRPRSDAGRQTRPGDDAGGPTRPGDDAGKDDWPVYRVEFRRLDEPDPRDELAHSDALGADDVAAITARLDRLDRASAIGPWTRPTLRLIAANEGVRAPDLAASVGRETAPFKLDVRKLKNLGLTISLRVGYLVSPRGRAYLAALEADVAAGGAGADPAGS